MSGSVREILPDGIGEEAESIITELLERKLTSAARLAIDLLQAMERHFGPEAREVAMRMARNRRFEPRSSVGTPQEDLRTFCGTMERNCVGSHRWERVIDEPDRIGYYFSRCLWAGIFRKLGEPDLGFYYCAGDEPAVRAFNPDLGFRREKVLMKGDKICDHVFYVK
ncbi:MAG TPA: L-2-amino-thiazoline-4-carboxylic acid hydrolase [Spirochaetia bacterium]|nr:L-2-amino-thiazoline-4-carboxylic acid hydrolase [Spirochaetia bacterium]